MSTADWNRIGADLAARQAGYDGFVVARHRHDGLHRPGAVVHARRADEAVILTACRFRSAARSDARDNLLDALILAGSCAIPEVMVASAARCCAATARPRCSPRVCGVRVAERRAVCRTRHRHPHPPGARRRSPAGVLFHLAPSAALRSRPAAVSGHHRDFSSRGCWPRRRRPFVLEVFHGAATPARDPRIPAGARRGPARGVVVVVVIRNASKAAPSSASTRLAEAARRLHRRRRHDCRGGADQARSYLFAAGLDLACGPRRNRA